jgi:hypothetical protein
MITESKINDVVIDPLHTSNYTTKNVMGWKYFDLFPYLLFISAKKKSGKTSLIWNILKNTTNKHTKFFIFCSTYNVDKSWIKIIDFLEKRGNVVEKFGAIREDKNTNNLDIIIDALTSKDEVSDEEEEEGDKISINFGTIPVPVVKKRKKRKKKKKKKKKPEKIVPEYMFLFDDISNELRNPAISRLLKIHRHLGAGCNVILSSQYVKDIQPQAGQQIDYFITFKNFSEDRLKHIHKLLDLSIDFEDYLKVYYYATEQPYQFLYTNTRTEEMRKGFNTRLVLN